MPRLKFIALAFENVFRFLVTLYGISDYHQPVDGILIQCEVILFPNANIVYLKQMIIYQNCLSSATKLLKKSCWSYI